MANGSRPPLSPQCTYVHILLHEPHNFWTSLLYSSLAYSHFHQFSTLRTVFCPLSSQRTTSALKPQPSVSHFDPEFHLSPFPFFSSLDSPTSLMPPGICSRCVTPAPLSISLYTFFSPVWTLWLSSQPLACSPGYQPHFSDRISTLELSVYSSDVIAQNFLGPTTKTKAIFFFRKIITRSCTLVPIYSHTVMPSSLNTTYPESVSLSFTHHPFPVSILLHKVLPWIHSFFLRRWPYLLHRHPRDPMGPCVLRFLFFSPRHWSAFTPLPASPLLIHWIECIPLEKNLSPFNHLFASQLPSICLLRSLVLYLFSLQVFFFFLKLTVTDHFHILPQALSSKLHTLFPINSITTLENKGHLAEFILSVSLLLLLAT